MAEYTSPTAIEAFARSYRELNAAIVRTQAAFGRMFCYLAWMEAAGEIEFEPPELELTDEDRCLLAAMKISEGEL